MIPYHNHGASATLPQVWDLREGALFYTLHGHEGATLAGAFSPAGDYFASAGADEQVSAQARSQYSAHQSDILPDAVHASVHHAVDPHTEWHPHNCLAVTLAIHLPPNR